MRLQEAGETAAAEAALQEALAADPNHTGAQMRLAAPYMHAGRFDEAVDAFTKVVALDPGNSRALANLGTVLQALGRNSEAETRYGQAIAADPSLDPVHLNLGHLFSDSGRPAEAINAFRTAVGINPRNPIAQQLLASALIGAGGRDDIAEALTVLGDWGALNDGDPQQAYLTGAALLVSDDVAAAIPHLTKAAEKSPETAAATLARALVAHGRHAEAEPWFVASLKGSPDKNLMAEHSQCLRELGRLGEATQVFNGLLAVDRSFAPAHLGLGSVLQVQYRHEQALVEFEAALGPGPRPRRCADACQQGDVAANDGPAARRFGDVRVGGRSGPRRPRDQVQPGHSAPSDGQIRRGQSRLSPGPGFASGIRPCHAVLAAYASQSLRLA